MGRRKLTDEEIQSRIENLMVELGIDVLPDNVKEREIKEQLRWLTAKKSQQVYRNEKNERPKKEKSVSDYDDYDNIMTVIEQTKKYLEQLQKKAENLKAQKIKTLEEQLAMLKN